MSLCVVELVIRAGLMSVGKLSPSALNRWADGTAQCDLLLWDAWGSFVPESFLPMGRLHVLHAYEALRLQ